MVDFSKFEGQNEIEFHKRFPTKEACLEHLAHYKWAKGFICPHCGGTQENHCYIPHYKRCKDCQSVISPTSNTLFHKVKFDLVKAFYAVFKMSATTKSISAEQLSKTIGVNRKTALLFQQKIRLAMKSSENHPLMGQIEVDEAFIGQKEENNVGRGTQDKAQIVVAVEKNGATGVKRMYVRVIKNASAQELKPIFDKHISPQAKVLTDKWKGYSPITELFQITQEKSEPDKNFKVMHRCIQQLKSWIRGIHHSVDPNYLQGYLDEFCYRINRSIHKNSIFENLLSRMMNASHTPKKLITEHYRW
jgi:transposase-like protein